VFWIAGGCLGCLGSVFLAIALLAGFLYQFTQPPVTAVKEQLAMLRAGEVEGVYEALDERYREAVSLSEFADFVGRHPTLREHEDSTFWTRSFDNNRARIGGTLTSTDGEEEQAFFRLRQRGDSWYITAIEVEGDEAR
jgi:hypothetical protein